MDRSEVTAALYEIFEDFFELAEEEFTPDLTAEEVDEWDSLNHVRLMLAVEQRFAVKFTVAEISSLKNVGELIALIERKA